jgi:hypothetical protein
MTSSLFVFGWQLNLRILARDLVVNPLPPDVDDSRFAGVQRGDEPLPRSVLLRLEQLCDGVQFDRRLSIVVASVREECCDVDDLVCFLAVEPVVPNPNNGNRRYDGGHDDDDNDDDIESEQLSASLDYMHGRRGLSLAALQQHCVSWGDAAAAIDVSTLSVQLVQLLLSPAPRRRRNQSVEPPAAAIPPPPPPQFFSIAHERAVCYVMRNGTMLPRRRVIGNESWRTLL